MSTCIRTALTSSSSAESASTGTTARSHAAAQIAVPMSHRLEVLADHRNLVAADEQNDGAGHEYRHGEAEQQPAVTLHGDAEHGEVADHRARHEAHREHGTGRGG